MVARYHRLCNKLNKINSAAAAKAQEKIKGDSALNLSSLKYLICSANAMGKYIVRVSKTRTVVPPQKFQFHLNRLNVIVLNALLYLRNNTMPKAFRWNSWICAVYQAVSYLLRVDSHFSINDDMKSKQIFEWILVSSRWKRNVPYLFANGVNLNPASGSFYRKIIYVKPNRVFNLNSKRNFK